MTRKPVHQPETDKAKVHALKRLQSNRRAINVRLSPGQTADLLAMTMALQASLRAVLDHLAVEHGAAAGPWLDDLENELVTNASNIWSEGATLDAEVRAMDGARRLIQEIVAALRERLEQSAGWPAD